MDDAIIGVLVGGGLGVATQVLISIVNWASQCRQFRHEETMRRNTITPLRFHHLPRGVVGCY